MSTEANANSSGGAFGSNSDTLSSAVPMLDEAGKNWGVFLERFKVGVQAKRRWGHFDGTKVKPTFVAPANVSPDDPDSVASVRAAAEATRLAREEAMRDPDIIKKREEWDYSEAVAYYLLIQKVPEGIVRNSPEIPSINRLNPCTQWRTIPATSDRFNRDTCGIIPGLQCTFADAIPCSGSGARADARQEASSLSLAKLNHAAACPAKTGLIGLLAV